MNRRDFLAAAAAGALLTSCAGRTPSTASPVRKAKQNFVFILTDDLAARPGFRSTFMRRPVLTNLFGGQRFTDAYAACPVQPDPRQHHDGKYPARMPTTDWFGAPQRNGPCTQDRHKPLLPACMKNRCPVMKSPLRRR